MWSTWTRKRRRQLVLNVLKWKDHWKSLKIELFFVN